MELQSIIAWAIFLLFGSAVLISSLSYLSFRMKQNEKVDELSREGTSGPFTVTIADDIHFEKDFPRGNAQPYTFTTTNYEKPKPAPRPIITVEKDNKSTGERMIVMYPGNQQPETYYSKRYYMPDSTAS